MHDDTEPVHYKLMNDYSAAWPFWGGREGLGLCADGDPALPADVAAAARSWAAQFDELFDHEHGWPDRGIAMAHEAEGQRIHTAIQNLLPEDDVVLRYWERSYRKVGDG
jgi:hypothetical protein